MPGGTDTISGLLRDWLAAMRSELNGRFRQAQRRFPQLDPEAVLALCRELLPPLVGSGEPGSADLLSTMYDLILLHAGRGTLSSDGGSVAGIGVLLRDSFPRLRRLLLTRPRSLPGALSNAVENLGPRGVEFARDVAAVAAALQTGDELLDAGVVLAWRLGDARCRVKALDIAARLPPRAVLEALKLPAWPEPAAPVVIAALAADAWSHPEKLFTPKTLEALAANPKRASRLGDIAAPADEPLPAWTVAGRPGNFAGFGGHFLTPPVLLNAGEQAGRHRFWVSCDDTTYRIDADVFGWTCRPDPSAAEFPVSPTSPKRKGGRASREPERPEAGPQLQSDGTFTHQGQTVALPLLAGATSFALAERCLAFTLPDSFRIRVLAPPRKPL
jgi:hypothetical protein